MSAVNDIVELVVVYSFASQRFINTFGFQAQTALSSPSALATAFKTSLVKNTSGGLLYQKTQQMSCTLVEAHDVVPGTAATVFHTFTAVAGSDGTNQPLPPQSAMVTTWYTALKGRSYRGRTYEAGLPESLQNAGVFDASAISYTQAWVNNLLAIYGPGGTDGDWRFGVISRFLNGVARATPIWTAITSGQVRSTVYNQRRRTLGAGQ